MVRGLAGTERRRNVFAFCLAKSCGFGYGFQPLYGHKGFFTEYCRDQCVARMHPREGPWPGRPGRTTLIHPIAIYYEASIQILAGSDASLSRIRVFLPDRAERHKDEDGESYLRCHSYLFFCYCLAFLPGAVTLSSLLLYMNCSLGIVAASLFTVTDTERKPER